MLKKIKFFRLKIVVIVIILSVIVTVVCYGTFVVKPMVHSYCSGFVKQQIMLTINDCSNRILKRTKYNDFFEIVYDDSGQSVLYVASKTDNVNILIRSLIEEIDQELIALSEQKVGIPSGAFTGLAYFSNKGKEIEFQCITVYAISSNTKSRYDSVGINQTKHTLTMYLMISFDMILPYNDYSESINVPFLLTENVIVGKIPDVYIASEDKTDYLDLLP